MKVAIVPAFCMVIIGALLGNDLTCYASAGCIMCIGVWLDNPAW